ncbi:MAG: YdcF family protein [Luminiphilus sp.]|nr:YdcF family protein [Luminiphilus sp.]
MLLATKLLSLLVYPLSLGLLLLLVAVISGAIGRRGLSWLMTLLAFLVIYFPATEFGSEALMQPLEGRHPAFSPEELPAADAIVLLGGASNGPARFGRGADLNDAADRVMFAAELYFSGKAPIILISGGSAESRPAEAELLAQQLQALQIPRKQLLLETQSRTTFDNAVMAGEMLKNAGLNHILLVTSGVHMRRSLALFEKQGLQVTAAATDHQIPQFSDPYLPGWVPTFSRLARSSRAIHEWVGYWAYDNSGKL